MQDSHAAHIISEEQFRLFSQQQGVNLLDGRDIMELDQTHSVEDNTHRGPELLAMRPSLEPTVHVHKPTSSHSKHLDSHLKQVRGIAKITNDHPVKRYLTPGNDPVHITRSNLDRLNMSYGSAESVEHRNMIAQRNFDGIKNRSIDEQDRWSLDVQLESNRHTHRG